MTISIASICNWLQQANEENNNTGDNMLHYFSILLQFITVLTLLLVLSWATLIFKMCANSSDEISESLFNCVPVYANSTMKRLDWIFRRRLQVSGSGAVKEWDGGRDVEYLIPLKRRLRILQSVTAQGNNRNLLSLHPYPSLWSSTKRQLLALTRRSHKLFLIFTTVAILIVPELKCCLSFVALLSASLKTKILSMVHSSQASWGFVLPTLPIASMAMLFCEVLHIDRFQSTY